MEPVLIITLILAAAALALHFLPKQKDPTIAKAQADVDDVWTWIADHLKGHAAPGAAPVAPATSTITHTVTLAPPAQVAAAIAPPVVKPVAGLVRGQGLNPGVADPYATLTDAQWASISAGHTADDMYGYFNDNAADQKLGQASAQGITGTGTKMTDAQIAAQAAAAAPTP